MNRELLRAWATYYYRTEVLDRALHHRIVHGTARVWPPFKDLSHEQVCALVDELGEVPRPQPQRFVDLRAFVA